MSRARTNKENRPKRPSTLGLLLGGTGGRKDASKGAEAERQRRRRERDRSREMAAYVGYDAMYRDGIAQVMPGVFSQTVEFSDISYQSARKEARETAFTVMSSLFNYFPADSHVQLQVVNAPIPADEVGRKVFFEPGERATAELAEEYNRILNDKMHEVRDALAHLVVEDAVVLIHVCVEAGIGLGEERPVADLFRGNGLVGDRYLDAGVRVEVVVERAHGAVDVLAGVLPGALVGDVAELHRLAEEAWGDLRHSVLEHELVSAEVDGALLPLLLLLFQGALLTLPQQAHRAPPPFR